MTPFVRHMLLCQDIRHSERGRRSIDILGLISNIYVKSGVILPVQFDLTVYLAVTSGRGRGTTLIRVVSEGDDVEVNRNPIIPVAFSPDPLRVQGLTFRIPQLVIPQPDVYSVEFWYNGLNLTQQPIKIGGLS